MNNTSTCSQSSWTGAILPGQNLSRVSHRFRCPGYHVLSRADAAAIYVLHKEDYLPSAEAIRTGEGVNDNASLRFEAGKTYKIRIINMSALASKSRLKPSGPAWVDRPVFYIALDQHDIYVIETDGIEIEPYKLDVLTISAAQRYSILVTAKESSSLNYALSVMQAEDMCVRISLRPKSRTQLNCQVRCDTRRTCAQQHPSDRLR